MLKNITPNLMVKDVNKSVEFYRNILGFEFIMGAPEDSRDIITTFQGGLRLVHALVKCGNVEFMFHKTLDEEFPEFKGKDINATMTLYIVVENIENFYNDVTSKALILKKLNAQWYGMKEFYIKDPDGYILGFAEKA